MSHDRHATTPLAELQLESTIGAVGVDADRTIPRISMASFDRRRAEISEQLWAAATEIGFFQLTDHGIEPTVVDGAFERARAFFALPDEVKAASPWRRSLNSGWESKAQVRPSTGVADQKESYQLTRPHMEGLWPSEEALPGFAPGLLAMEAACWEVAMRETVIVGLVGAGGLGRILSQQNAAFDRAGMVTTVAALVALALVVDLISASIRADVR